LEAARQDSINTANENLVNQNINQGNDPVETTDTEVEKTDETDQTATTPVETNNNQVESNPESNNTESVVNENNSDSYTSRTTTTDTTPERDIRTIEQLSASNEPKRVKRGGHLLELQHGNYIVAGVFEDFEKAEGLSDTLFERDYRDVIVGYVSHDKKYHVVLFRSQDLERTKAERNRLKGRPGLEKIWLLTVE